MPPEFYHGLLGGIWPRLVGGRLAPLSRPGELADGVLEIHVKNQYWKTQLETLEADIVRRIADFIPSGVVRQVVLRVSPERFPDRPPPARRQQGRAGRNGRPGLGSAVRGRHRQSRLCGRPSSGPYPRG